MKKEQTLYDRFGSRIGTLKQRDDGNLEIYDKYGSLKGSYNIKNDETRDRSGRRVGYGNVLATLIAGYG